MDMARRDVAAVTALQPGRAWPLGATVDAEGVNFAVFSQHATRVELCLFDAEGHTEVKRLPLPGRSGDVFHGHLPGARAGLVYGLRAYGPWRPDRGHRFNPQKLLLDPWAREIVAPPGGFDWKGPHLGADREHPQDLDTRDNGPGAFKARVVGAEPTVARLGSPPGADTVIYELHVRGFTKQLPGVPEPLRGTYAGLAHEAAIGHLRQLGVTTVCLLPVQQHLDEAHLAARGLVNYWGYNTLGFFCPEPRYASANTGAGVREEFRALVRRLHEAGIEVLLDVVYNHTPEGDERGPTLAWRGLDNASYYRLHGHAKQQHENWTGCGNTLDIRHPRVLQMVMDSLRHWVQHYGVDGFRFDLAPVLGRGDAGFERDGPFFKAVLQDPVLQGVRLVAEPWDLGPGGYQLGQFPRGWQEWNDRFRDTARAFWLGGDCTRGEFALRLAGSSDLYQPRQRPPLDGVNYVVSHDGFTLADLVSYDLRHNEANGEGILRLAAEQRPYHLAVSLHGATEEERSALVPASRRWPLAELMDACRAYFAQTGRRIFFEWTLIAGQNDSPAQAERLGKLLHGLAAHVNLIPLNPTGGFAGTATQTDAAKAFQQVLQQAGFPSTVRQRRGIDVAAGCGQLRAEKARESAALK